MLKILKRIKIPKIKRKASGIYIGPEFSNQYYSLINNPKITITSVGICQKNEGHRADAGYMIIISYNYYK